MRVGVRDRRRSRGFGWRLLFRLFPEDPEALVIIILAILFAVFAAVVVPILDRL